MDGVIIGGEKYEGEWQNGVMSGQGHIFTLLEIRI